jgi:hypothetical protein
MKVPRLRAVTLVEKDSQAGHFGVQARACPRGSMGKAKWKETEKKETREEG